MVSFVADLPKQQELVRIAWTVESDRAAAMIAYYQVGGSHKEDSYARSLTASNVELSPLFRYGLAMSIGELRFRRIARYFEQPALLQYHYFPDHYDTFWARLKLPSGLRAKAAWFYDQLISRPFGAGEE